MNRSFVVTGGGRGVGRAIVERLLEDSEDNFVVAVELDSDALGWIEGRRFGSRIITVFGDASDEAVAEKAADLAEESGVLTGWVNNAAVFRDAFLHNDGAREVLDAISANLDLAVVGCATAVRRFLSADTGGSIVNVSSHQAAKGGSGRIAIRHREGRHRRFYAGFGGGLRTAGNTDERGFPRFDLHRKIRRFPRRARAF